MKVTKTLTTSWTRTQFGDSFESRGETWRHLRQARGPTCKQLRHRRRRGTKPSGRRTIWILSLLRVLTSGDFSELGQVSVAWRKPSSQPTGRCEQYTHKYSTYRVAHNIITFHHATTRDSMIAHHLCVLKIIVIHVSCLACPCLLPLLFFPMTSQTPTTLLEHGEHLEPYERSCVDLRQSGGFTQTVTPTGYEPKVIETNVIDAEAISPEDLEPEGWSLTETLEQIQKSSC